GTACVNSPIGVACAHAVSSSFPSMVMDPWRAAAFATGRGSLCDFVVFAVACAKRGGPARAVARVAARESRRISDNGISSVGGDPDDHREHHIDFIYGT